MTLPRFFVDTDLSARDWLVVEDARSHYIQNVLRLVVGTRLTLFNLSGGEYLGEISEVKKSSVSISLLSHNPVERESHLKVNLALSCLKREKMDFAIQKATELGTTLICPVVTDFSSVKSHVLEKRWNHWRDIIYSACEQCGRNRPPELAPLMSIVEWLSGTHGEIKLICHPVKAPTLNEMNKEVADSVSLAVGPEGGFSPSEFSAALTNGFIAINLGPRILRAETAVVTSLSLTQSRWGDL